MSESHGSEVMDALKKLFKKLAELISKYPNIVSVSQFVFVPGLIDPCTPHLIPRCVYSQVFIIQGITKVNEQSSRTYRKCQKYNCSFCNFFSKDKVLKLKLIFFNFSSVGSVKTRVIQISK